MQRFPVPLRFLYFSGVLLAAFFVYFKGFANPPFVFWDENYHIASAQKYLAGVMYMEPHPPLGKLLIALGEWLLRPNADVDTSSFLVTDYVSRFPPDYSFEGMRFIPTLLATLSAPLFFLLVYRLVANPHIAVLFSTLYLFDNALIVHSRSAMLEASQLFFVIAALLFFLRSVQQIKPIRWTNYAVLALLVGLAIAVKANSAVLLLLLLFLFEHERNFPSTQQRRLMIHNFPAKLILRAAVSAASIAAAIGISFYLHFSLGTRIEGDRVYKASTDYQEIIAKGETADPRHFFTMLRDNIRFMREYQQGVPKLDYCKPGENGSHPIGWPVGHKSINYRWEKSDDGVKYLYLQGNPVVWGLVLISFLLAAVLILSVTIFGAPIIDAERYWLIEVFFYLFTFYMIGVMQLERVMYLYHYFIPLIVGMGLCALIFSYLFQKYVAKKDKLVFLSVALLAGEIFAVYLFFSPLTYYSPLLPEELSRRAWFSFWELSYVR